MSDARSIRQHSRGEDTPLFATTMRRTVPNVPENDKADTNDVQRMIGALKGKGGMTRDELSQELGWSARKVRAVRRASRGSIISCAGQEGFYLASEVTVQQWQEIFAPKWLAAISDMNEQYSQMCRAVHAGKTI